MSQVNGNAEATIIGDDFGDGVRREIGQHVLLSPAKVAEVLEVPESTLALWRGQEAGAGPPFLQIGKRVSYLEADILVFIEKCRRTSTKNKAA